MDKSGRSSTARSYIPRITINQQDAAVRSQFYCTAGLHYMFRVLSTPIIRSILNCITASGTYLLT